jgi:hypothetical protein
MNASRIDKSSAGLMRGKLICAPVIAVRIFCCDNRLVPARRRNQSRTFQFVRRVLSTTMNNSSGYTADSARSRLSLLQNFGRVRSEPEPAAAHSRGVVSARTRNHTVPRLCRAKSA